MPALNDACNELLKTLSQVEADSHVILDSLNKFEVYTASFLIYRLLRRLAILAQWIARETKRLYAEHQGNGYVCVFFTERNGITVYWVEDEKIVANKERLASFGLIVRSSEVAIEFMCQLIGCLESNNWLVVVQLLNKYGRSPGVDFSQFLIDR